jgi:hypothetical protein
VRVKTKSYGGTSSKLEIEKADADRDVFIGTQFGGFYVSVQDVPRIIAALKWAAKTQEGSK